MPVLSNWSTLSGIKPLLSQASNDEEMMRGTAILYSPVGRGGAVHKVEILPEQHEVAQEGGGEEGALNYLVEPADRVS